MNRFFVIIAVMGLLLLIFGSEITLTANPIQPSTQSIEQTLQPQPKTFNSTPPSTTPYKGVTVPFEYPTPIEQTEQSTPKQVFTWFGHTINESNAQWLSALGFTDIIIRYVNETEFQESKNLLEQYGIHIWRLLTPSEAYENLSTDYFPTEPTLIDDLHLLSSEERSVVVAKASMSPIPLLLTVYCEELNNTLAGLNLSNVDVDLYGRPTDIKAEDLQALKLQARSVGVYLWIWRGYGFTWDSVMLEQVQHVYELAEACGVNRLFVWMGSEADYYEQGMAESSLINHPEWFQTIKELNEHFKTGS